MRSSKKRSTPSVPLNAFSSSFLRRIGERSEPPTADEADFAGPWVIEQIPILGYGICRAGEGFARGIPPTAIFHDRWLALIAAAVLPGVGQDRLLNLRREENERGGYSYAAVLDDGSEVGSFLRFDQDLFDGMNTAISLLKSPEALARLLEAAGTVTLERCGAILEWRMITEEGEASE